MKQYLISPDDSQQRLDKFLKKLFPGASLWYLYKLNRKGNIKIITTEEKKVKRDNEYKLQKWEKVQVFISDSEIDKISAQQESQREVIISKKLSKKDIVFEDRDLLLVNKNPWTNVHPADHKSDEVSLIEQVHDYFSWAHNSLTFKPSLAHRIDRDTSWIVIIAKSKKSLVQLTDDFKKHDRIKKKYYCIVIWKLSRKSWTIRKKLKRIENAKWENKVQVSESWLEAISHYKLIEECVFDMPQGSQIISTVEVTIETWRMHQIRVHMWALWNPILWDKNYGDKKINAYFQKNHNLSRQMLHAWKIELLHPTQKKKMCFEAKLKEDMKKFISLLHKK